MAERYLIIDCPHCRCPPEAGQSILAPVRLPCGLCFDLGKVRVSKNAIPVIRWVEMKHKAGGGTWVCDETAIGRLGALTEDEEEAPCPE